MSTLAKIKTNTNSSKRTSWMMFCILSRSFGFGCTCRFAMLSSVPVPSTEARSQAASFLFLSISSIFSAIRRARLPGGGSFPSFLSSLPSCMSSRLMKSCTPLFQLPVPSPCDKTELVTPSFLVLRAAEVPPRRRFFCDLPALGAAFRLLICCDTSEIRSPLSPDVDASVRSNFATSGSSGVVLEGRVGCVSCTDLGPALRPPLGCQDSCKGLELPMSENLPTLPVSSLSEVMRSKGILHTGVASTMIRPSDDSRWEPEAWPFGESPPTSPPACSKKSFSMFISWVASKLAMSERKRMRCCSKCVSSKRFSW
mmetsp:Transcript_52121/g.124147  ORF Transcript_52121/g.124147 Transcript_52121/m.124147 type:complete len:312 (-) Transcript_52121:294-1229(-)